MGGGQVQNITHYTCIIHDRLSMYSTLHNYNVKVDNQNNKTKFDSKNKPKINQK